MTPAERLQALLTTLYPQGFTTLPDNELKATTQVLSDAWRYALAEVWRRETAEDRK